MKVKIRLNTDSYITNGKITNIIERIRGKESYDLVEVKCDDWMDIKQVSFKGLVSIPMEIEDDEVIFWKVESIENTEEDIKKDIEEIRDFFKTEHNRIITHEIEEVLYEIEEMFEHEVRKFL